MTGVEVVVRIVKKDLLGDEKEDSFMASGLSGNVTRVELVSVSQLIFE